MANILEKALGFKAGEHSFRTEVLAGITTFLTMAYILAVNPSIFSALADMGMPTNAVFLPSRANEEARLALINDLPSPLIEDVTSTTLSSFLVMRN